jgi:hypothetical protein
MQLHEVSRRAGRGLVLAAVALAAMGSAALAEKRAPLFTLYDVYGQPVSLKAYRGSLVWLTFGSTW